MDSPIQTKKMSDPNPVYRISIIIFYAAKLLESNDESEFATILLLCIFIYLYSNKLTLVGQYFMGKMLGFTKPDNCVMSRN